MDTTFTDQQTKIVAAWLNDVNVAVYRALGAAGVAPTTAANVLDNLGFSAFVQTVIGAATAAALRTLLGSTTTGDALFIAASAAAARTLLGTQTVTGVGRNIAGRTNSATPNSKIDITADELIVKDSTGAAQVLVSVNVTVDITASGANGLDTGAEASSTWYYGWVIAKADGTTAGLLSASSSAPTMPSGYTFKALVSAVRNDGSSNFVAYYQNGRRITFQVINSNLALNGVASSVVTSFDISSYVPAIAKSAVLELSQGGTADGSGFLGIFSYLSSEATSGFQASLRTQTGAVFTASGPITTLTCSQCEIPITTAQTLYYRTAQTAGTNQKLYAWVAAFTLPGGGE